MDISDETKERFAEAKKRQEETLDRKLTWEEFLSDEDPIRDF
jgi:hypothetical protein|tara:strand:+ start:194 stop:319 length:126 start_codon:yes stop_codon:yes gene_type:complete